MRLSSHLAVGVVDAASDRLPDLSSSHKRILLRKQAPSVLLHATLAPNQKDRAIQARCAAHLGHNERGYVHFELHRVGQHPMVVLG